VGGVGVGGVNTADLRRRAKRNAATRKAASPSTPPTTPPAIAPTLLPPPLGASCWLPPKALTAAEAGTGAEVDAGAG